MPILRIVSFIEARNISNGDNPDLTFSYKDWAPGWNAISEVASWSTEAVPEERWFQPHHLRVQEFFSELMLRTFIEPERLMSAGVNLKEDRGRLVEAGNLQTAGLVQLDGEQASRALGRSDLAAEVSSISEVPGRHRHARDEGVVVCPVSQGKATVPSNPQIVDQILEAYDEIEADYPWALSLFRRTFMERSKNPALAEANPSEGLTLTLTELLWKIPRPEHFEITALALEGDVVPDPVLRNQFETSIRALAERYPRFLLSFQRHQQTLDRPSADVLRAVFVLYHEEKDINPYN